MKFGTVVSDDDFVEFTNTKCIKIDAVLETSTWTLEAMDEYKSEFYFNPKEGKKQEILSCVYTLRRKNRFYVISMLLPLMFLGNENRRFLCPGSNDRGHIVFPCLFVTVCLSLLHSPENRDKFGKRIGLNKLNTYKSEMGQDQVSGWVSVPCRYATLIANVLWKPIILGQKSRSVQCHDLV